MHCLQYSLRRELFKLKNRGTAQNRVENAEIGVLRGGGYEGDLAVFYKFQQGLLLALVEILDLIQIEQNSLSTVDARGFCKNLFRAPSL